MADEIGWIKVHRKTLSSRMYQSMTSAQRDVMMCCLLMANHEENEWEWGSKVFKCAPGQFITSLPGIKKMCAKDVSIQAIRTTLVKLEKWGFLTGISTETGRLLTINNWGTYQDQQQTEQQTEQQTANRQPTAIEEGKEVKKNKKEEGRSSFLPPSKQETSEFFREKGSTTEAAAKFWYHYDANGWMCGRVKMKSWSSAAKKWILENKTRESNGQKPTTGDDKANHAALDAAISARMYGTA